MDIILSNASGKPIYEQITDQVKEQIMSGALGAGDALPSMRLLAKELRISVITTKRAYEELEKEGMVYSVPGKGFYVDNPDRDFLEEKRVRGVEEELAQAVKKCKEAGISKEEVKEMVEIFW